MKISHAKYSVYEQCPFKYKCHYIDGLAAKYEKETPQLFLGNIIHQVLYKFFQIPEHSLRTEEKLLTLLKNSWSPEVFASDREAKQYYDRAIQMLKKFYEKNDMNIDPESLEEYFEIPIGSNVINGFMDRVDKRDGGVEIIDYKTGRYVPSQKEVDENMQLSFYYIGYSEKHKTDNIKLSFYYLDKSVKITTTRTNKDKKRAYKDIKRIINRIEFDKTFKPTPNKFCNWCDYAILCPAKSIGKNEKEKFHNIVSNLYLINNVSRYLTSILELNELYSMIVNKVKLIMKATEVSLMLLNEKREYLSIIADSGKKSGIPADFKLRIGEGLAGLCASSGSTIYVKNVWSDSRYIPVRNTDVKISHPMVCIPIQYHDEAIGVLNIERGAHEEFFENDMILIKNLSVNISTSIVNARLYNDIDKAKKTIAKKLSEIMTLYKISKIVNTSKDIDEILNLSLEVVSTDFGVQKSVILLKKDNRFIPRAVYGIDIEDLSGFELPDNADILNIVKSTEEITKWADFDGLTGLKPSFKQQFNDIYVVPLKAAVEIRGLIVIFSLTESMNDELKTLLNIFSQQIAPIVGLGIMLDKVKKDVSDPFTPLVNILDEEIENVKQFDLGLDVILIRLKNYDDLVKQGKFDEIIEKTAVLQQRLQENVISIERVLRADKKSFLDILPANSEVDLEQKIEMLNKMDLKDVDIVSVSYPAAGKDGFYLLNNLLIQ